MAKLKITIQDGKAVVEADGSKISCDTAHAIEKGLGKVTKSVPTGTHTVSQTVTQK